MKANYEVIKTTPEAVTIIDLGPWDRFMTVTNAAEEVVKELFYSGDLKLGQRLFYYDSENVIDELLIRDGEFVGFAAGPKEKA